MEIIKNFTPDEYYGKNMEYPVYLKNTRDMGVGVFASRNIKKNEICCFYDGIYIKLDEDYISPCICHLITGNAGYNQQLGNKNRESFYVAGFTKCFRDGGVGQLQNDYSTTTSIDERRKYLKDKKTNTFPDKLEKDGRIVLVHRANRKIKKNEQLFHDYSHLYWKYWSIMWSKEEMHKVNRMYSAVIPHEPELTTGDDDELKNYICRAKIIERNYHAIKEFSRYLSGRAPP